MSRVRLLLATQACSQLRVGNLTRSPKSPGPIAAPGLISIFYCKWFMLVMTLDMPDEGTC